MSSLAATQADGYYLPPAYYESGAYKKKGKNAWYRQQQQQQQPQPSSHKILQGGSHASKSSLLIVRFELVDPCVCEGCEGRIGKGTRFNAEKVVAGTYLSSDIPIYEFRTKCRKCGHPFCIRTDPARRGFAYGPGIRQQMREWDAAEVEGLTTDKNDDAEADHDPLAALEHRVAGDRRALSDRQRLEGLYERKRRTDFMDDGTANAKLRHVARQRRNTHKRQRAEVEAKGWAASSFLSLLEAQPEEAVRARQQTYGPSARQLEQGQWKKVRASSIFEVAKTNKQKPKKRQWSSQEDASDVPLETSALPDEVPSRPSLERRRKSKVVSVVDLTKPEQSAPSSSSLPSIVEKGNESSKGLSTLLASYDSTSEDEHV